MSFLKFLIIPNKYIVFDKMGGEAKEKKKLNEMVIYHKDLYFGKVHCLQLQFASRGRLPHMKTTEMLFASLMGRNCRF